MSSFQWCNNTLSKNVVAYWEQANGGADVANATRRRAALEALSHVVGNKRGVNMHSYSDAKMTDFLRTFYSRGSN